MLRKFMIPCLILFSVSQVWANFGEYYHIRFPQTQNSCSQEATKLAQRFSTHGNLFLQIFTLLNKAMVNMRICKFISVSIEECSKE